MALAVLPLQEKVQKKIEFYRRASFCKKDVPKHPFYGFVPLLLVHKCTTKAPEIKSIYVPVKHKKCIYFVIRVFGDLDPIEGGKMGFLFQLKAGDHLTLFIDM